MLVKCKACDSKIEKNDAYKVIINEKNNYYCNEIEYRTIKNKKEVKENTYTEIYDIFGRKITNTILYKEIGELSNLYTYENILAYLKFNHSYLSDVMAKQFTSEFAQIRYFSAILKNSLSDFKVNNTVLDKELIIDMPRDNYKPKQRKKCITEYEMEVGD